LAGRIHFLFSLPSKKQSRNTSSIEAPINAPDARAGMHVDARAAILTMRRE
jgi:hypothetical protein